MRYLRLLIEYEGTCYVGWQVQPNGLSIQKLIEDAVFRVTRDQTRVTAAGRTDAGVHALGQVAAFHTQSRLPEDVLLRALNANLPSDIRILEIESAPDDFHPRYGADSKRYTYFIQDQPWPSVFLKRWTWSLPFQLDLDAMKEGLGYLVGKHDFSSFRAAGCASKHPVRNITKISIERKPTVSMMGLTFCARLIKITIEADALLRHMVRNIAGLAVEIGRGKIAPEKVSTILELRDRRSSGPTAPACGLFLERVSYRPACFENFIHG